MIRLRWALAALFTLAGCTAQSPTQAPTPAPTHAPAVKPSPGTPAPQPDVPRTSDPKGPPALDYVERIVGGADPATPLPMVIAVHGLGDRPEQFVNLLGGLPFPARVIAPRAPIPWRKGHAWFDYYGGDDAARAHGLALAADVLAEFIEQVADARPTKGRPLLTGFSQGGMLSFAVATRRPELIAGAVPLAGKLERSMFPAAGPAKGPAVPIRAFHGDQDRVVLAADAQATVAALRAAGRDATLELLPGLGHRGSVALRAKLYEALSSMRP